MHLGVVLVYRYRITGIGIKICRYRRSHDRLIFTSNVHEEGIYFNTGSWWLFLFLACYHQKPKSSQYKAKPITDMHSISHYISNDLVYFVTGMLSVLSAFWKCLCLYLSALLRLALILTNYGKHIKAGTVCIMIGVYSLSLQWRHNGRDGVSNHQPHDYYSTVYSGADQRKHQSSVSLAFVRGIHLWPVNSPHKWPVTREMFPFDDVIMMTTVVYRLPWRTISVIMLINNITGILLGMGPPSKRRRYNVTWCIILSITFFVGRHRTG